MVYQYKKLKKTDSQLLRGLIKLFGEVFEMPETYLHEQAKDEYLLNFLANPNHIVLVSTLKDKIVGGLVAYVFEKYEQERKEMHIYDLAVDANFRRKKIATNLILKLKELGKSMGVYLIFVQADYVDPPAIKLYESFGKREEILHFDIKM